MKDWHGQIGQYIIIKYVLKFKHVCHMTLNSIFLQRKAQEIPL